VTHPLGEFRGPSGAGGLDILEEQDCSPGQERRPDPKELLVDPRSLSSYDPAGQSEAYEETLARLAAHYRSVHWRGRGEDRWIDFCRCAGFGPRNIGAREQIQRIMVIVLSAPTFPTLREITRAMRAQELRFSIVA
jgi:hypothetical protein